MELDRLAVWLLFSMIVSGPAVSAGRSRRVACSTGFYVTDARHTARLEKTSLEMRN